MENEWTVTVCQRCSPWYLYLYSRCTPVHFCSTCTRICTWGVSTCTCTCTWTYSTCRHVLTFLQLCKSKKWTRSLISLDDPCQFDCNLSLCSLLSQMSCMLANCKLSIKKLSVTELIDCSQSEKSSLPVFVFRLSTRTSKPELVILYISHCRMIWHILCHFGVCLWLLYTVAKQLDTDFRYSLQFISDLH